MYREGTLSVEEIAREVGVSRATVYNWIPAELRGKRGQPVVAAVAASVVEARLNQLAADMRELCDNQTKHYQHAEELRNDLARLEGIVNTLVQMIAARLAEPS